MQIFIKIDDSSHVILAMYEFVGDLHQDVSDMIPVEWQHDTLDGIHDYILKDGELILDEDIVAKRKTIAEEEARKISEKTAKEAELNIIPEIITEQDAAICALYEMILGGGA